MSQSKAIININPRFLEEMSIYHFGSVLRYPNTWSNRIWRGTKVKKKISGFL